VTLRCAGTGTAHNRTERGPACLCACVREREGEREREITRERQLNTIPTALFLRCECVRLLSSDDARDPREREEE